jgi:Peptidase A4 family
MPVIQLPSGATITTLTLPPADFNAATADEQTLLSHGLPPRPVESPELTSNWLRSVGHPSHFIQPEFKRLDNKRHGVRRTEPTEAGELPSSPNWSGAVVFAPPASTFNGVSGEWNVPTPTPPAFDGATYYSSFWIGIDGDNSPDVFQAGVECEASAVGGVVKQNIYLWWEWYPENEVQITNFPVESGQTCTLSVTSNSSGNVFLKNLSTGVATAFQVTAPTGTLLIGNCAEWIAERPEVGGSITKLADYGTMSFSSAAAKTSLNVVVYPVSGDEIDMTDGPNVISEASVQPPDIVRCVYSGPVPTPSGTGFEVVGSNIGGDPAAVSWARAARYFRPGEQRRPFAQVLRRCLGPPGRLDIFARANNGDLLHKYFEGAWGPRLFNAMEWPGLQGGYRCPRERRGSGPGRGCWFCLT